MPLKSRFMFYNLSIPSSYKYESRDGRNLLVWSHITNSCIESIKIERNSNPKRIFEELLLVMKELKHTKTDKWYKNNLVKSIRHELNVEINTFDHMFLKQIETNINLLKNLLKSHDAELDYAIHITEEILKKFPIKEELAHWTDLIKEEYNKSLLDFTKMEYISKNLLNMLLLNGYSFDYILDLDRHLDSSDFSKILSRLTELNFSDKEFVIHVIFKGFIRSEEEKAEDAFKYDTIYVYNPKSENLPEEISSDIKFLFSENNTTNLIGFRIFITALDPISALDKSRMTIYEMLNIFAWDATKLEEVKYLIKGETRQVIYRYPRLRTTDDLFLREDIFVYMNEELKKMRNLGSENYSRFSLYLRKIRQYRLSDSLEERIINLWLSLESLIGEIGNRKKRNSKIMQFFCTKAYIISRSY